MRAALHTGAALLRHVTSQGHSVSTVVCRACFTTFFTLCGHAPKASPQVKQLAVLVHFSKSECCALGRTAQDVRQEVSLHATVKMRQTTIIPQFGIRLCGSGVACP